VRVCDVCHLLLRGSLFGLDGSASRACLSTNARAALAHGAARRLHGAIMPSAGATSQAANGNSTGKSKKQATKKHKKGGAGDAMAIDDADKGGQL
jgi:hypothetical protein